MRAGDQHSGIELPDVPGDYRLQMEVVPEPGATSFGLVLCADGGSSDDGLRPALPSEPEASRVLEDEWQRGQVVRRPVDGGGERTRHTRLRSTSLCATISSTWRLAAGARWSHASGIPPPIACGSSPRVAR